MKKVIIDCDSQIEKFVVPIFKIGFPEIEIVGVTVAEKGQEAVDFIIDTIKSHPDEITVVTLSALTNIAAALEKDLDTMGKIRELIIVGGAKQVQGDFSPVAEKNFGNDPKAAEKVFKDNSIKKIMVGLDVTEKVIVPDSIKKLFLAVGILGDSTVIQGKKEYVEIETKGIAAGQSVCDVGGQFHEEKTNAEVAYSVDNQKLFLTVFGGKEE